MSLDRRNVVFNLAPVVLLGLLAPQAAKLGRNEQAGDKLTSLYDCNTCDPDSKDLQNIEDFERAFEEFGSVSDIEIAQMAKRQKRLNDLGVMQPAGLPLPGPAAIVSCALTAAWVFRKGVSKNQVIMQVTEVIVGCVGIPATSWVLVRVARLVWKYRKKIAAALAAVGLTAAQLAPIRNAPYPG
ncbi:MULTISPECIES: hypothetical protein [unclassified Glutamicibacter]|uniref:hypothetical protein n=1 Tax=unclassified Glutamicibacter TaxID=2627139 RepID=UPI00380D61A9